MRKPTFAILFFSLALGASHCGGDDSTTGGSAGGGGSSATTGNTATSSTTSGAAGSTGSTTAGSGGAGGSTGTGGAGGGLVGSCPASQPANGSPCPNSTQLFACPYGSTVCGCGQGQPWTCVDLDGGFRLDGFSFDGNFGGG